LYISNIYILEKAETSGEPKKKKAGDKDVEMVESDDSDVVMT